MILKEFVYSNKEEFLKGAKDVVNHNPEFVRKCIKEYECPNVFEELKRGTKLRQTKFFHWWDNRRRYVKNATLEAVEDKSTQIRKTTKEVVKKKIVKEIKTESKDCIVIQKQPINQTIEITRTYQRLDFQTTLARKTINEVEKELNLIVALRKNTFKSNTKINKQVESIIANAIERYTKEARDKNFCYEKEIKQLKEEIESFISTGVLLDKNSDEYKRYEELKDIYNTRVENFYKYSAKRDESILNRIKTTYDIREKQGNEYVKLVEALVKMQMAIKATIENEKQIKENNLYEKTKEETKEELDENDLDEEVNRMAEIMQKNGIKELN